MFEFRILIIKNYHKSKKGEKEKKRKKPSNN